jgi:hypothetical protein
MRKLLIFFMAVSLLAACDSKKDGKVREKSSDSREKDDYRNDDDDKTSKDDRTEENNNENTTKQNNWPASEVNAFTSNCVTEASGGMERAKAVSYCNCMLEKMQELYPDVKDAARVTDADMETASFKALIQDCLFNNK